MIPVYKYIPVNIIDGNMSVGTAGNRLQLSTANVPCVSVTMTARSANTGIVCIGGSSVVATSASRTGVPLSAGDIAIIEIINLNKLYLDATVSGEGVSYYYKN